ncbi:polysaccharide deacetylase family protein [Dyadobacter psychrotolerans]|uniref:Polysaccharide deacetylase n=1 Tax=Dyadobacter psychrotolerans TaxID=2541721 RepID=A0A4R5DGQ3_9BACT|nr:polysaccharide deacetylase family protein [Dyadobacter psychrotolerans]TDE12397.1 polysaccharide deacetylase [Dyadobacter psychrotolerans]
MKQYEFQFLYLIIGVGLFVTGCSKGSQDTSKSGIAISFDDHFINEWYALRPLFQKYNAKVTFFITCGDSLKIDEIEKLKQLQKDGHEIGFHGTVHSKSTELIKAGAAEYIKTELTPGLKYMADAGFFPSSYAHPGGNHNERVDSVLLAKGFKILRDVAISRRVLYGIPLYTTLPRIMSWIYYPFDQTRTVDALLIDQDSEITDDEIKDAIVKAKKTNTALMLFGHKPLYAKPVNGEYGFNVSFLETILKEAEQQNLKFYTMTELVEVR